MNLYIRFFNDETLVSSLDEAIDFLSQVTNDQVEETVYRQLADYFNSSTPYPRRFKVRARLYFICIKTTADTMEQFKARGQQSQEMQNMEEEVGQTAEPQEAQKPHLAQMPHENMEEGKPKPPYDTYNPGWYEAEILFKRVLFNEVKGKNEYVDTAFSARVKAHSVKECYDMICSHLMGREDIDNRSQMPSIKGRNFSCKYLGMKI